MERIKENTMSAPSEDCKPVYDRALLLHGPKRDEVRHPQTHAGGIEGEGGASTRPRRRQAKDVARRFGVSFGTAYKQVGAAAPEK